VVVVVEENKAYSDVIGSKSMPFLNSLAAQGGLATNYFAVDQPSLPNYLMLTTGQTIVSHTETYTGPPIDVDSIVRELKAAGKTWKSYAESLPSVGYLGGDQYPYIQHHNPFVLLADVVNDPAEQQNIVPVTQLATDLAAGNLPDYSFVVPNNQNNSHDCPPGMTKCSVQQTLVNSDTWLKNIIGPVLDDPNFQKSGLLFIVWDESNPNDVAHGGGHVACVLAGGLVKPGFQSANLYQHQSVLRTALKVLGITTFPGEAATAPDMSEFLNIP
jgi:acid phosphatase